MGMAPPPKNREGSNRLWPQRPSVQHFLVQKFPDAGPRTPTFDFGHDMALQASEDAALDVPSTAGMDGSGIPSTTGLEEHLILGLFH